MKNLLFALLAACTLSLVACSKDDSYTVSKTPMLTAAEEPLPEVKTAAKKGKTQLVRPEPNVAPGT